MASNCGLPPPWLPILFVFLSVILVSSPSASSRYYSTSSNAGANFMHCFNDKVASPFYNAAVLLTRNHNQSAFEAAFFSSANNKLYSTTPDPWPSAIILPVHHSHVQAAILCARRHRLILRIRSGGHDFAGLSYRSVKGGVLYVIVDLARGFRSIRLDLASRTAWVGAGATLGELYYHVARESGERLAFPAGMYSKLGLGGHIGGGGVGNMIRRHGIAADNVVDAKVVDSEGRLFLDRGAMGEDLFWAIRGGGAASFAVVLEYKLKLVEVPPRVTVFDIDKTFSQGASALVTRWQHVAPKLVEDLYIAISIQPASANSNASASSNSTSTKPSGDLNAVVKFRCMYLGKKSSLLPMMAREYPELGVTSSNCKEMTWIESAVYFSGYAGQPLESLLDRTPTFANIYTKMKYDFVQKPISEQHFDGLWEWVRRSTAGSLSGDLPISFYQIDFNPMGGAMAEIPDDAVPFPHRKGNLYKLYYTVMWTEDGEAAMERHLGWVRELYRYVTPFVSKHPRRSYLNSRDLDLGTNPVVGQANYSLAKSWGCSFFNHNFRRLAVIKGMVDPQNFFWSEQSIPPYPFQQEPSKESC